MVREALGEEWFTLLDIGCSGGIDAAWRGFGERLRAVGIDPNLDEIARLTAQETSPGVTYIPGFVGLPAHDEDAARLASGVFWSRNPWIRLSTWRTTALRASAQDLTGRAATRLNLWPTTRLANRSRPVLIDALLAERGIDDVDFIKIDVDGPDFLILQSLTRVLRDCRVLGVGAEVNFFGSDEPDVHTFHNTDRLLRSHGFSLCFLSSRPYSLAALPARYLLDVPAQTEFGRPLQGDAIYLRDAVAPENAAWAAEASARKLLKLAALHEMTGLPDGAADILTNFRERLADLVPVDEALDALVSSVRYPDMPATYAGYLSAFEADAPCFYPQPKPAPAQAPSEAAHSDSEPLDVAAMRMRPALSRAGLALIRADRQELADAFNNMDTETLRHLAHAQARLHPLAPFPGWRFDSFLEEPDIGTFLRFGIWSALSARGTDTSLVLPWYGGTRVESQVGTDMSLALFVAGRFEPNEFALLDRVVTPGMTVIDGGANEGVYSLFAATRTGPTGRVLAIEPSPRELARLRRNLLLSAITNVDVAEVALAEEEGTLDLLIAEDAHAGQNTLGDFMYAGVVGRGRVPVRTVTLDALLRQLGIERVDVIKLDLEGAEVRALRGAGETLRANAPLLMLEAAEAGLAHQGATRDELLGMLRDHGYRLLNFAAATGLPEPVEGLPLSDTIIAVHPRRPFGLPSG
jgi:FkbM family methyltransferase